MNDVLHTRIEDVKEFNVRIVNCLTRIENIKTVSALTQKSTKQIMSIPWMGRKSVNIIKNYLSSVGLSLNDEPTQVSMKKQLDLVNEELDRTKKQLKTAVSALKYIQDGNLGFSPAMDFAEKALEQITALGQKDK